MIKGKKYYELHVTFKGPSLIEYLHCHFEPPPKPWTYSRIDGDPMFGEGVKQYLTTHCTVDRTIEDLVSNELANAKRWLIARGFTVLRSKVELVVHDEVEDG